MYVNGTPGWLSSVIEGEEGADSDETAYRPSLHGTGSSGRS
jgi:hypothetical protein